MNALFNFPPAPLIFLLGMAGLTLLAELFIPCKTALKASTERRGEATLRRRGRAQAAIGLSLAALAVVFVWLLALYPNTPQTFFNGHFLWDSLAALLGLGIVGISFLGFAVAEDYLRMRPVASADFYLLGLFSVLGALVLVTAGSFLSLYLGLELMSLPLYALVALERHPAIRTEAAMKYIIMGAVASAFLLYGLSLVYGETHSLMLDGTLNRVIHPPSAIRLGGLALLAVGIAFKLGAAPFHFWAPDVYEGAPLAVGFLIGAAPKLAIIGMALRLMGLDASVLLASWGRLFLIIAVLSLLLGNLVALVQTNIKRLLAWSSVAHMGYAALGLAIGNAKGLAIAVFYTLSYALMAASGFTVLMALSCLGTDIEAISDLRGLGIRHPWLAFLLLVAMFSMAGIPPFIGFFAKFGILEALLSTNHMLLACLGLLFSVIGAYYYLNVVKAMYFEAPCQQAPAPVGGQAATAVSFSALLLMGLGLFPDALVKLCQSALVFL